ncbi:uncharacterized protein HMPREF1541_05942 [Cyphellophora europaea CBS 101466]|uniref:Ribosome quality control complex subunit 2 n=1 Tax=Cyphellophora europaea (strain CBS 101466) TaxID=1220924 RepID=W2RT72_CYPE1|nr:uncharacterized protein HMPREF1541_05942 [Cyphellophora europaea CBS 101466]ETN39716.1 hypothetical protein HMPREF1541_05942 [Cyphellophora europaea CBS 101466]
MKQRFSSIDVRVLSLELASVITSLRVSNIYDLSSRIFLFKFQKPGSKQQLLVDSGFRCHLTSFARTTAAEPSPFVKRLRKYLKSRRVTGVKQIGTDRVIEIDFSGQYKLYLEFFAAGNVILTDADLNVLALLRQVNEGDDNVDVRVGGKYVLEAKQNYNGVPPVSAERARDALEKAAARAEVAKEAGGKKAKRAKGGDDLRKALSAGFPEYPAHLLDCAFSETETDVSWSISSVLEDDSKLDKVIQSLRHAESLFRGLETGPWHGYIVAKLKDDAPPAESGTQPTRESLLYDDFHPFRPTQFAQKERTHILEIPGFNAAVDDFYSSIESQKLSSRLTEREERARQKIESAKSEHDKRLGALQHVQEIHIRKAQAIEVNTHRVEEACAAINGLIGQGMDWVDIGKLIEGEQDRGNVVASMIKLPLKLEENTVTLLLEEASFEDSDSEDEDKTDSEASDSDDEDTRTVKKPEVKSQDKRLPVDIDLALSPWSNARQYYDQKKLAAVKEQKTLQASSKALKSTERKITEDLKRGLKQEKDVLREVRQLFWFEKFLWFISSDGYLVLSGKDAPQSEILFRRYLRKGDIYVHADLPGASPVVVKNNPKTPDAVIPPGTLSQAGAFCVCGSTAWESKAIMSAWWVEAERVSRVHEQTGELISGGGVAVKGKKNWLPPTQLLLGFAVGWLISAESRKNHGKLRVGGGEQQLDEGVRDLNIQDQRDSEVGAEIDDEEEVEDEDNTDKEDGGAEIVPDVEDAADVAEHDIEEDVANTAAADEEEGNASDARSDDEAEADFPRSNPLQLNGSSLPQDTNRPSEDMTLNDDDDNEASDDDPTSDPTDPIPSTTEPSTRPDTPAFSIAASAPVQPTNNTKSKPQPAAPTTRGKRSKAKKAAQKYAHQDDEDKALAMELLGSTKAAERRAAEEEAKRQRDAKAAQDRERRKAQHERAAAREQERAKRLAAAYASGAAGQGAGAAETVDEEVSPEELERERRELEDVDLIVASPAAGDEVLAAIPVCAPWGALSRHKYKVKLQPGNLKKGKMVREVLGMWAGLEKRGPKVVDEASRDKEKVWRVELERLKALRDVEVLGCVPVRGCRVVQGGGMLAGATGNKGGGGGGKGKGAAARGSKGGKKR